MTVGATRTTAIPPVVSAAVHVVHAGTESLARGDEPLAQRISRPDAAVAVAARTVGLPCGLTGVEQLGVVDLVATAAELVTIAACIVGAGLPHPLTRAAVALPGRA